MGDSVPEIEFGNKLTVPKLQLLKMILVKAQRSLGNSRNLGKNRLPREFPVPLFALFPYIPQYYANATLLYVTITPHNREFCHNIDFRVKAHFSLGKSKAHFHGQLTL